MPSASFTYTVEVQASHDAVWAHLNEPQSWESIGPVQQVHDATFDEDGHLLGFRWNSSAGPRRIEGTAAVNGLEPKTRFALELDAGELVGSLSTHLEPMGNTTSVAVTLDVRSNGGFAAMFFPLITEVLNKGLPQQVEAFAQRLTD